MGGGHWTTSDWTRYKSAHIDTKTGTTGVNGVFSSRGLDSLLNPKGVIRESRDSVDNPNATPIGVALDVTGSMGRIAEVIAREGLAKLAEEIYARKPVTDPHIMFMGVGDAYYDSAPFQATQFEADIRIAEQLQKLFVEGGGGGNRSEGYILPYYFFARHVVTDHNEKRGKKGFLFTVGDERPTDKLTREQAKVIFGDSIEKDITMEEALQMVSSKFHVYHIVIEQGYGVKVDGDAVREQWKNLLGQHAIFLNDYNKLAEVIISILEVNAGADADSVSKSWGDKSTSLTVWKAIKDLAPVGKPSKGVVKLD